MIPRYLLVTGTDTGVGKTIATAALAAALAAAGRRVIIVKPVQTGHISPDDPERTELEAQYSDVVTESDAQIIARLAGIETFTHHPAPADSTSPGRPCRRRQPADSR